MARESRPPRLINGCPMSGFEPTGPNAGQHCGCDRCCFCGREHPEPLARKSKRRGVVRRKERLRAAAD